MEYASASRALVHPDTPVISLNEALADCQSDAHAGQIAAARSAHESPEYPLSIGGSNTTPAIQHPDFQRVADLRCLDTYGTGVRGVLDGIVQQIDDDLGD
jgi:hypothetical protein